MLNEIFGPTLNLLVLDLFLDNPDSIMNLRKISDEIGKNPGSISRIIPLLVENGFLKRIVVGKKMTVYKLEKDREIVHLILDFHEQLKKWRTCIEKKC